MTFKSLAILAAALALPAFSIPALAQISAPGAPLTAPGERQAMRMVRAEVTLKRTLVASKEKSGDAFTAILARAIKLDNGPELPKGTVLTGEITADTMKESGTSRLALRFTQATLKDGTIVPVKATIVGVFTPEDFDASGNSVRPGEEVPNTWNDGTLQLDQLDVLPSIDLHSSIANRNSGVFTSTKKDDVVIAAGSEMALAIAYQRPPRTITK